MSTLDQAFIRAYTKDRRSANASASESRPTSSQGLAASHSKPEVSSSSQAQPGIAYPDNANRMLESDTFEPSKWYRFDGAIKQHVRHQHAADGINHTTLTTYHIEDVKQVATPANHAQNSAIIPPATASMAGLSNNKPTDRQSLASYLQKSHLLTQPTQSKNSESKNYDSKDSESSISKVDYVDWTQGINFVGAAAVNESSSTAPHHPAVITRQPAKTIDTPERDRTFDTWRVDTLSEALAAPHIAAKSTQRTEPSPQATTAPESIATNDTHRSFSGMGIGKFNNLRIDSPPSNEESEIANKLPSEPFQAVWEVDQLIWPEINNQLFHDEERAFSKVAAHLSDACRQGLRVLAVTSPSRGEGRSTVAGCLARCVAQRGLKVALLDGDLESPSLADSLNLEVARGWSDAILEGLPLEEVAVQSIEDQLTLIPLLTAETTPHIAPTDRRITAMFQRLRESFDLIIVDATHINSVGSRMIGTDNNHTLDAIIMVKDNRNEDKSRVDMAIRRIKTLGVSSVGIVENFSRS